ncbi:MAG TPA: SpoIID/LytB domain-containing protein [Actinopolymorphaceae bacterium]
MARRPRSPLSSLLLPAALVLAGVSVPAAASAESDRAAAAFEAGQRAFRAEYGPSHASGQRPELGAYKVGNPTTFVHTLRIGLRYSYAPDGTRSEFYGFDHPYVEVTGTADAFHVVDLATGDKVVTGEPGQVVRVEYDGNGYVVTRPDGGTETVEGPVRFRRTNPENTFRVESIVRVHVAGDREYVAPDYRGELEVARGPETGEGMVNLVNVVELEDYVRGVVINESPAFFHVEALKSQAVAARGYAVANIGRFIEEYPFDLDDSTLSQVYRGRVAEHPNGDAAVDGTEGLVASYDGEIISAFYSSSMAGHPENVEWSFYEPGDPSLAVPYLVGRYDGPAGTEPDLSTEEGLREFWENDQPQVYDSQAVAGNSRNRWAFTLTKEQAEQYLEARKDTATVISGSSDTIGDLTACDPTRRSPTGRIVVVRCAGTEAVWEFANWDNVRRVFPSPTLGVLNNPVFLDHTYAADGTLESIRVIGGGWGHNVGMSQYGAHGRGQAGQSFGEILTFYYKDTVIGSYPIDLRVKTPRAVRQNFVSIDGSGTLQIRDAKQLRGLTVTVNDEHTVQLSAKDLAKPVVEVDLGDYLEPGRNSIAYVPRGRGGSATALVLVYPN